MKYRKKPVVIDAVQVTAADYNPALPYPARWDGAPFKGFADDDEWLSLWLMQAVADGKLRPTTQNGTDYAEWEIETLEGTMRARPGDWIIRGVEGEIYPCKDSVFQATYEPA